MHIAYRQVTPCHAGHTQCSRLRAEAPTDFGLMRRVWRARCTRCGMLTAEACCTPQMTI